MRRRLGDLISTSEAAETNASNSHPAVAWNVRLREHGGHLLQSWTWGDFKQRHGWIAERILVDGANGTAMAQVLFRRQGPLSIGYIPRGPMIAGDVEALWPELWALIDRAARRQRAISVIVEPNEPLGLPGTFHGAGVVAGPAHFQPERTVVVPLLDDEALLKQMHQKTRYNVRLAYRRGVDIREMERSRESIETFYGLMQDTAQRNEFGIHSFDYYNDFVQLFGDDAVIMGAWSEGNLAAAVISAAFGDEAVYMYGGSSTQHRAHGAAFALQFEAMKWGRTRDAKRYDLWGIPLRDPESTKSDDANTIAGTRGSDWRGLYRFKTGFGGEILTYPQTMERRYVPVFPWLAQRMNIIHG